MHSQMQSRFVKSVVIADAPFTKKTKRFSRNTMFKVIDCAGIVLAANKDAHRNLYQIQVAFLWCKC